MISLFLFDFFNAFILAVGIIAQIHDNEQIPTMYWKGHYLIPGRRQRMLFNRRTYYRLTKPYSDYDTKVPSMLQVAFDHFGNGSYAYEQYICAIVCIQVYVEVFFIFLIEKVLIKNKRECFLLTHEVP